MIGKQLRFVGMGGWLGDEAILPFASVGSVPPKLHTLIPSKGHVVVTGMLHGQFSLQTNLQDQGFPEHSSGMVWVWLRQGMAGGSGQDLQK